MTKVLTTDQILFVLLYTISFRFLLILMWELMFDEISCVLTLFWLVWEIRGCLLSAREGVRETRA